MYASSCAVILCAQCCLFYYIRESREIYGPYLEKSAPNKLDGEKKKHHRWEQTYVFLFLGLVFLNILLWSLLKCKIKILSYNLISSILFDKMKIWTIPHFDCFSAVQHSHRPTNVYTQICAHTGTKMRGLINMPSLQTLIIQRTSSFTLRENGPASFCHVRPPHSLQELDSHLKQIDCAHTES